MENAILKFYGSNVARMLDDLAPVEQKTEDDEELGNGDYSPAKLQELARQPSLVNLVNLVILEAIEARASDIHIEPFEHEVKIKYRIDGMLVERTPSSRRLRRAICAAGRAYRVCGQARQGRSSCLDYPDGERRGDSVENLRQDGLAPETS
jgi:type II secretory ATPase GspE/PulE/Tfp pilus assembly ATPase PilB-like protein